MAKLDKKTLWLVTAAAAAVIILLQFCPATRQMSVLTLTTSSGTLHITMADSPERRLFALGTLTRLPPDRGLWLVFEDAEPARLWSKNLQVEADLLWLDDTRQIVDRDIRAKPCLQEPCPDYAPDRYAVSVLLVPPGVGDDATFAVGQTAFIRPGGSSD